jgi:pSer/pThr/pTyr-binding forkhead associated (FHA) protein
MVESPQSNTQDLSDELDDVSEPADFPFEQAPRGDDAIISSLDGRPGLLDTTRDLLSQTLGPADTDTPPAQKLRESSKPSIQQGPLPVLVIESPGGTIETSHPVDVPRFLVGRDNCDLELADRFVARWHVQLFRRDGALVLQDLSSRNGVYLRIADDLALEDGDQIALGEQRFEFRTTWDTPPNQREGDAEAVGATWSGSPARLIRYIEGNQIGGVYPLEKRVVIGSNQADLCFSDDTLLSAAHAVIHCEPDRYLLRDLDSDFGTFIRIADAVELIDGDCFLVGRTRIRLTFP